VRAKNAFGWSEFSSVLDIRCATIPETPDAVTTEVVDATGEIQILWQEPSDNGSAITEYDL
jgi:hypothetical protein